MDGLLNNDNTRIVTQPTLTKHSAWPVEISGCGNAMKLNFQQDMRERGAQMPGTDLGHATMQEEPV
jgi:hypothetical protein